jgi:transposase
VTARRSGLRPRQGCSRLCRTQRRRPGIPPDRRVHRDRPSDFDPEAHRLDIQIDFAPGGRFACPPCGAADCPAFDTERKTRRHPDFFHHLAYLTARVPRVRCDSCGIKTVNVPRVGEHAREGRPDSGFTLLFEAMLIAMIPAMPVAAVARIVGEHDTRLCAWFIITSIRRGRGWMRRRSPA